MTRSAALIAVGASSLVLLIVAAVVGPPTLGSSRQGQNLAAILQLPGSAHLWGTGRLGEDMLVLCLQGLQKSLLIGFVAAVFTTVLATIVGTIAGYFGGAVDRVLMLCVDVLLVLPPVLLQAVAVGAVRDVSWTLMVIMLVLFGWMLVARMVRARTRSLRTSDVVRAAEYAGASPIRIIITHIVPQLVPLLAIDLVLNVSGAVLAEAGLSYFGLGIQPPEVSLGTLIAEGTASAVSFPWVFIGPVGSLMAVVFATAILGEGIRERTEGAATA